MAMGWPVGFSLHRSSHCFSWGQTRPQTAGRLFVTFYAQDAERARFLAGFRQELDRWLTSADLESVRFLVGAKDPARTLLEKIVHGVTGMVDTSA